VTPAWHPVAPSAALAEGALLGVVLPDGAHVLLARHRGTVYAVEDSCPHQGFPLAAGELTPDGRVECPWHGATFDCRTGAVADGPATDPLPTWMVRESDGTIAVGPPRPVESA
jgi:3-phenylpropionate/trans-cinnamate dioxygenase ferredoxin subunit